MPGAVPQWPDPFRPRPQATGKSTAMGIHHWWRFRGGKICFYRGTEDTARTADMLSAG